MERPFDLVVLDMLRGMGLVALLAGALMLTGGLLSVLVALTVG